MNLDKHHRTIIKELSLQGENGEISYNQLFNHLKMNKKTFNKKPIRLHSFSSPKTKTYAGRSDHWSHMSKFRS